MATTPQCKIALPQRVKLLTQTPIFESLPAPVLENLALKFSEENFDAGIAIVREGEEGHKLYVIAQGRAEVNTEGPEGAVTLATLEEGETFGELALIGPTHKRQATVQAVRALCVLALGDQEFQTLISQHPVIKTQIESNAQLLLIAKFLKQATPFAKLDAQRAKKLAQKLKEINAKPSEIIIRQGDLGDSCYLLREGQVEVLAQEGERERRLTILEPGALFGETALLSESPRTATVRALTSAQLFVLKRSDLVEVMGLEKTLSLQMIELMRLRERPLRSPGILTQKQTTADGETVTILKDPAMGQYYKLSRHGWFLWQLLDGQHNMRDLVMGYFNEFKAFAPQSVVAIIGGLSAAGFTQGSKLRPDILKAASNLSLWQLCVIQARKIMEFKIAVNGVDQTLTKIYDNFARYLYTRTGQLSLGLLAITGLGVFLSNADLSLEFLRQESGKWPLIALFFVANIFAVFIHEAGHALTVKAFGREVPRVGIGWYWFGPMAFVDTSDMWLAPRWQRVAVSFAGPYSTVILAGLAALTASLWPVTGEVQPFWILALGLYAIALFNLNPLLEYDGYYMLMDGLDFPNLRSRSFAWLGAEFPKAWRDPRMLKSHRVELIYSLGSIASVAILALVLVYYFYAL